MMQTETSTSCLSLKQRSFYCWLWGSVWTILKIAVKLRRRTSGAQIYCFSRREEETAATETKKMICNNYFPDFDFVYPSSINLEQWFKAAPSPSKDLQVHETNVWGVVWWLWWLWMNTSRNPDASQTYFIRWDIIDLPSPQIGAKTLFLVFFYSR